MNGRLASGVRWVGARVPRRRHRHAPPVSLLDPVRLQAQTEALDDVEHADLEMLVAGQLRVQSLAQQRPELAGILDPVVEASRVAGREQVIRLLDERGRGSGR